MWAGQNLHTTRRDLSHIVKRPPYWTTHLTTLFDLCIVFELSLECLARTSKRTFLCNLHASMWYQHDCAPAHFDHLACEYLTDIFGQQVIEMGCPDLIPPEFFFWEYVKSNVYKTPVEMMDELTERIFIVFDTIRSDYVI